MVSGTHQRHSLAAASGHLHLLSLSPHFLQVFAQISPQWDLLNILSKSHPFIPPNTVDPRSLCFPTFSLTYIFYTALITIDPLFILFPYFVSPLKEKLFFLFFSVIFTLLFLVFRIVGFNKCSLNWWLNKFVEETAKVWSLKGISSQIWNVTVEYPSSLLEIRSLMAPGGTVTQNEGQIPST